MLTDSLLHSSLKYIYRNYKNVSLCIFQDFKKAFKEIFSCMPSFTDSNGNTTASASASTRYMAVSNIRGDKTETQLANNGEIKEMSKNMEVESA